MRRLGLLLVLLATFAGKMNERCPSLPGIAGEQKPFSFPVYPLVERYVGEDKGKDLWVEPLKRNVRFETKYLTTEEERAPYELHIRDGRFYDARGKPFSTKNSGDTAASADSSVVVMTGDGRVYVVDSRDWGKFHHSSFTAGAPVAFAGEIRLVDGRAVWVSNRSGHYRPPKESITAFLKRVEQGGVVVNDVDVRPWSIEDEKTKK